MKKSSGAPPGTLFVPRSNEQYEDADVYIAQLKKMIEDLKAENYEYFKYRCHLKENARAVYKANILLEIAIREHFLYLLELLALFPQLQQNPNIILFTSYYYEKGVKLPEGVHSIDDINAKMLEYEKELLETEESVEKIMEQLAEYARKMHFYRILLSLITRLIKINILFTKEIKNCLSYNYKTEMLKEKIGRKDELEIDKSKIKDTTNQIDNYSKELYQCLPLYDQVQQIGHKYKKNKEISENLDDFEEWLGIETIELNSIVFSKSQSYLNYEKKLKKIDKKVTIDEEKEELKKIIKFDGYGYLNDHDRKEYLRRLQLAFGLIRTPRKERSNKSKKNQKICKVHNSQKVTKIEAPENDLIKKKSKDDDDNNDVITALTVPTAPTAPKIEAPDDIFSLHSDSSNSIGPLKFESPYASRKFGQPLHFTYPIEFRSYQKELLEEEDESYDEFTLTLPSCSKKEKVELVDVETCTNSNEFLVKPPKLKKANSPRRKFKYDPSIFYTPILPPTKGRLKLEETDPVRLEVTLKDIGLEGLDSATPDRTQQIWYAHVKNKNRSDNRHSPKRRYFMKKF